MPDALEERAAFEERPTAQIIRRALRWYLHLPPSAGTLPGGHLARKVGGDVAGRRAARPRAPKRGAFDRKWGGEA